MPVVKYSKQVQMEQPSGYREQSVAGPEAFGAGFGQAISAASETINQMALKQQEQDDTKAVLDASEAYKKDIIEGFNGENGYYSLNGDNAKDVAAQSADFMTRARQKYEGTLNARQLQSFKNHITPIENSYYQGALNHQQKEKDAAFINTVNANIATNNQMIMSNYNYTGLMNTAIALNDREIAAFGSKEGWNANIVTQKQLAAKTKSIRDAFDLAVNLDNLDRAKGIIADYKEVIDKSEVGNMENVLRQKTEKIITTGDAKTLLANSGGNLDAALKAAEKHVASQSGSTSVTWDQVKAFVADNESGGASDPYTLPNSSGSGAYGKYQFMPDTWRGLMGDAPMTPANQEIAFEKMHKDTFNKYGLTGVLVANYAGTQNAERYAKGLPLIGDNGQEYSADEPQTWNGQRYPSVREYVENGLAQVAPAAGGLQTAEKVQKLQDAIRQEYATQTQIKNIQKQEGMTSLKNALTQVPTLAGKIDIINNSNIEPWQKVEMIKGYTTRDKSEVSAVYQLEKASIDGNLTEDMVRSASSYLTTDDQLKYATKAYAIGSKQVDANGNNADKMWERNVYNTWGDAKERQDVTVTIANMLDMENVKGSQRYTRAQEIMKSLETGKGSKGIDAIINYGKDYEKLYADYDPRAVRLTIQGYQSLGNKNPDPWEINQFLASIGKKAKTDPLTQTTLNRMIEKNWAITKESFDRVYNMLAQNAGG